MAAASGLSAAVLSSVNHHNAALAGLMDCKATVNAIDAVVTGSDMAAEIAAVSAMIF